MARIPSHRRPVRPRVPCVGRGVSVNARVTPASGTRLIGQVAHGSRLGRVVGGLAPDAAFRPDGSIAPIPVTTWVAGLEQALSPRLSLSGYFSGMTTDRTDFVETDGRVIGFGIPAHPVTSTSASAK